MSVPVPRQLVVEQWRIAGAMAAGGAWSLVPPALRSRLRDDTGAEVARVRPGSDRNLDAYAAWSGAPPERYAGRVPPHSASRWAMPTVARLTSRTPHPLLKVVNQGVRLQVAGPLPRGVPLDLEGHLVDEDGRDGRVRIHSRIVVSAPAAPAALTLDAIAVVPGRRTGPRQRREPPDHPWETIGTWRAAADDGVRFFRLTGDFNPIHTLAPFARRTRFGGPILHGFGCFARTFEVAQGALGPVRDLEVRFVAPVPLPSPELAVQVGSEPGPDGRRPLRLVGEDEVVHLVGAVAATTDAPTRTA